jgi:hypothetical protein
VFPDIDRLDRSVDSGLAPGLRGHRSFHCQFRRTGNDGTEAVPQEGNGEKVADDAVEDADAVGGALDQRSGLELVDSSRLDWDLLLLAPEFAQDVNTRPGHEAVRQVNLPPEHAAAVGVLNPEMLASLSDYAANTELRVADHITGVEKAEPIESLP